MPTRWVPVLGTFDLREDSVTFRSAEPTLHDGRPMYPVGNLLSDQQFGGGVIAATIRFNAVTENDSAGLILVYRPDTQAFIAVTLGGLNLCTIRTWAGGQWIAHSAVGSRDFLQPGISYSLSVHAKGSRLTVTLNGVEIAATTLPFPLPRGSAGLWALGTADIVFDGFEITRERPKAFVVMQFSSPFNELYTDVIEPICDQLGLKAHRSDQTYGPGLILADIERHILEAKVVVAEITPANPNVYYEVGYAHAMRKPTILIADSTTKLPFDVSPFRTLMYENSIAGKARVEAGFRKHLEAVQSEWTAG